VKIGLALRNPEAMAFPVERRGVDKAKEALRAQQDPLRVQDHEAVGGKIADRDLGRSELAPKTGVHCVPQRSAVLED
jgi:hypothetical protein